MDLAKLTSLAVQLRHSLLKDGICVDGVILFGSRATGRARPDSDYDIAVLSRDFGKNRFDEGVLLNIHAHRIHPDFESIPVSLHQWFEPFPASPIIQQIKEHGIFLI